MTAAFFIGILLPHRKRSDFPAPGKLSPATYFSLLFPDPDEKPVCSEQAPFRNNPQRTELIDVGAEIEASFTPLAGVLIKK